MNNIDSILMNSKTASIVSGDKKSTVSINAVKNFYQTLMDSTAKRAQEAEIKKKKRLSLIIQKVLAGIILSGDELQFLKNNAPMYFNQAIRQQMNCKTKSAGQHGTSEIEPVSII